jgi:membrane associated rhomboid family serine protease
MRESRGTAQIDLVKVLMIAFSALYVLQLVAERWLRQGTDYYGWFALSPGAVLHGQRWWTVVSYAFLQNTAGYTGGLFSLIFNLLGLYFFGGDLRDVLGPKRLAGVYGGFVVTGALAWCAAYALGVYWPLFGPSATLAGLFALYCCYHANEKMTFLAFFIIPVTVKPKVFCWCWVALDLIGFLFYEMMGHPSPLWNGHIANLAAMLSAYGYYRVAGRVDALSGFTGPQIELPRWLRRRKKAAAAPAFKVNIASRDELRAEVDRILDKINSEGFGALTEEEKRLLDDARDVLSHR